jgi:hypothetical protein
MPILPSVAQSYKHNYITFLQFLRMSVPAMCCHLPPSVNMNVEAWELLNNWSIILKN